MRGSRTVASFSPLSWTDLLPVPCWRERQRASAPGRICGDNSEPDHASVAIYLKLTIGFLPFISRFPALESLSLDFFFCHDEKVVKFHTYYSTWHLTPSRDFKNEWNKTLSTTVNREEGRETRSHIPSPQETNSPHLHLIFFRPVFKGLLTGHQTGASSEHLLEVRICLKSGSIWHQHTSLTYWR